MSDYDRDPFPFSNVRGTPIAVSFLLAFLAMVFVSILLKTASGLNEADINHLLGNMLFLAVLGSILIQFSEKSYLWPRLYSQPVEAHHWRMLFIVVPLIIISLGYEWFWDFMQLQLVPSYLESRWEWMAENPFINTKGGMISFTIVLVSAVIVAPVVEEVLFRGVIFDKVSGRWGAGWGMVASSLIFGFFHMDPIGAFIFGSVLCIVYVQTRSLLLPILCHVLNNGIALFLSYRWPFETTLFQNKEQLYSQSWLGIMMVVIGTAWLCLFIYKRYHLLRPDKVDV